MTEYFDVLITGWSLWELLAVLIVSIVILSKSADLLIDDAIKISLQWGVSTAVVGATLVSLGTTTPEAVVSVMAALEGRSELALGNSVGSIICNIGLILGTACLISPLRFDRRIVHSQLWIKVGSGVLLVLACIPWFTPGAQKVFVLGGILPQVAGLGFLVLLALYVRWSVQLAKGQMVLAGLGTSSINRQLTRIFASLAGAIVGIVISSSLLISSATEIAISLDVPSSVIAATLVAFGTSIPEFVVVVTATLKGRSEIAIGNVIGANILNVLFVAGAAAAVTPEGLRVEPHFFALQLPAMLVLLSVLRVKTLRDSSQTLGRSFGFALVASYLMVVVLSYLLD